MAASDVGAIGYFSGRRIVDLEGLITPEVNQIRAAGQTPVAFLREEGVEYLVLYRDREKDWPWLSDLSLEPAFTATLDYNTISATDKMIVYRIESWSR